MNPVSLRKAARRGLADEAADRIRDAILGGHFPPGSALREVELAADLGVSRGSVREGLFLLEREGIVRSAWHRGTTVIEMTSADIEEVYSVRAALDRLAATTAQARLTVAASSAEMADLHALVDQMATSITAGATGPALLALDLSFHDAIYAAAGNRRLTEAWQAIRSQTHFFQLHRVRLGFVHYRDRVVAEHREIAELLHHGTPAELAGVAEAHVHTARQELLTDLGRP
jgi:DNA-binding GntR family transcriptional regulator